MLSLACLLASIISMQWMKLEDAPLAPASAVGCTVLFGGVMLATFLQMQRMMDAFSIPDAHLVEGDLVINAINAKGRSARLDLTGEHELM